MKCTEAEDLLLRATAGESFDRAAVDAHARACASCGALADELAREDRDLRAAFEPSRSVATAIADRTIDALRRESAPRRASLRSLVVPFAAAAGFLLAVIAFPRGVAEPSRFAADKPPIPEKWPTGRIARIDGTVEMRPRGSDAWLACRPGDTFEMHTGVRTAGAALAEIVTSEGSRVRLNEGTEVEFVANRNVVLVRGQLLSSIAPAPSGLAYRIVTPAGAVTAQEAVVDVCRIQEDDPRTVVTVVEGLVSFPDAGVPAMTCRVADTGGVWGAPRPVSNPVFETRWVHPLLTRDAAASADEIDRRVTVLATRIDDAESAREIRRFGEHAGPALFAALQRPGLDAKARRAIAKVASDIAGPAAVRALVRLLRDADPEVRPLAFDALARLTGETLGQTRDAWRGDVSSCHDLQAEWERWLETR